MTDRNTHNEPICGYSDLPVVMCAHCSGKTAPSDPVITIKPRLTPLGVAARTSDGDPTWTCPLCGWTTTATDLNAAAQAHGVTEHPATFPARMTIGQRLAWIIDLATEARHTIGCPNPADRAEPHKHVKSATAPAPADLASVDALQPGETLATPYSAPAAALMRCSRIVWEALDDQLKRQHPQPIGQPQIETEARWLAGVWPEAQIVLDLADIQHVDDDTAEVCAELARLVRARPMPTIPCLVEGCHGAILSLGEVVDGWLWADVCTNNHRVDRHAVARRWREAQPMTLAEAAEIVGVPWPTLRRWASRGLIRSVGETRWKAPLYRLTEIRRAAQLAGRTA